ncbi:MAG TPA: L-2-hydroxyglutarate oxidase [Thermoanaerobaculia bacterium]
MALKRRDFIVIGGGIIGLSVARELKQRHKASSVTLLEKEPAIAAHASGRNSGVLHAGFYYSPDSLKARFTRVGNERLSAYCEDRRLPILRCGKLVVPRREDELPLLDELFRRGQSNGVPLQIVSADEAREIEPRAKVVERAIWSPTTSTVDPLLVMQTLLRDARDEGIEVHLGEAARVRQTSGGVNVSTKTEDFTPGFVVNAAGLYADTVARSFGFSTHYRVLPFRGVYLYSSEEPGALRTHLYPVPDPRFPFLGVHFTVSADGRTKIGPTAAPAFWREAYGGLKNFRLGEWLDVSRRGLAAVVASAPLRRHAMEELRKSSRRYIVAKASSLAENVRQEDYTHWGKPGIRAQLYDLRTHTLEMDFVLEGDRRSIHILNAVSPGFTCAMPFAEYVVDIAERG